jgi:hypothetical protein
MASAWSSVIVCCAFACVRALDRASVMSIALRFKSILRFGITAEKDLVQRETASAKTASVVLRFDALHADVLAVRENKQHQQAEVGDLRC